MKIWDQVRTHPVGYGAAATMVALVGVFESDIRKGILYFSSTVVELFASLWGWLWIYHALSLPGWVWVVAGIVSANGLLFVVLMVWNAVISSKSKHSEKLDDGPEFTEMRFKGAVWRWRWEAQNNIWNAIDIVGFCPVCDRVLVSSYGLNEIVFFCEGCKQFDQGTHYGRDIEQNKEIARIPGVTWINALDHVRREINYRARQRNKS